MSDSPSSSANSSQIKITANSAEEAVALIRKRFGDSAQVLRVEQVEQGGLKGLIGKPRLEIIVSIPNKAKAEKTQAPAPKPKAVEEKSPEPARRPKGGKPLSNLYKKNEATDDAADYFSDFEDTESPVDAEPAPRLGTAANPVRSGTIEAVRRAISMMEAVGFDKALIERARAEIDFKTVGKLPAVDLYSRMCDWLRNNFPNASDVELGNRRAFVGSCGSGKTSVLCKSLSADVFVNGKHPSVLKVDTDVPNSSDGLEAFCSIMGSELARSLEELEGRDPEQPLYIDMPGVDVGDEERVEDCKRTLDDLGVDERILVVNAAYDSDLIATAFDAGHRMGARYVIFTHMDEAFRVGKLWKFALNGRIKPLCLSHGPNPAGDYTFDVFSYLLERSFPNGRSLMSSRSKQVALGDHELVASREGAVA